MAPLAEQGDRGDFLSFDVGVSYDISKLLAGRAGAHVVTDQRYRWKEIELERRHSGLAEQRWSAFAKPSRMLNFGSLMLPTFVLQSGFGARRGSAISDCSSSALGQSVSAAYSFDEAVSVNLAAELDARSKETQDEWRKINHDLFKGFSSEAVAAAKAGATGMSIAAGGVGFLLERPALHQLCGHQAILIRSGTFGLILYRDGM